MKPGAGSTIGLAYSRWLPYHHIKLGCKHAERSAEVAAGDRSASESQVPERTQRGGDQVDGAAGALDPAVDEQRGRGGSRAAVTIPDVRRADDVQHSGLVLQAEEHHPARGGWLLPVGD